MTSPIVYTGHIEGGPMKFDKVIPILITLMMATACRKSHRVDATREIPPHVTEPKVVYGSAEKCLPYDSFPFRWDLGRRTGEPERSDTCELGAKALVCHTAAEVNRHNAWVKRILPPVITEILTDLGVGPDEADMVRPVVEAVLNTYLIHPAAEILDARKGTGGRR